MGPAPLTAVLKILATRWRVQYKVEANSGPVAPSLGGGITVSGIPAFSCRECRTITICIFLPMFPFYLGQCLNEQTNQTQQKRIHIFEKYLRNHCFLGLKQTGLHCLFLFKVSRWQRSSVFRL